MPRGEYAIFGADGRHVGVEAFTSAPGPMGWRYFATVQRTDDAVDARVDISVDAEGLPVRARIQTAEHELLVARRGSALQAILDAERIELEAAQAFVYPSPGFFAVELHRLRAGDTVAALSIDPTTLVPRRVPRTYRLTGEQPVATPVGGFDALVWHADDDEVAIVDELVLGVAGAFELRAYEPGASGPRPRLRSV